MMLFIGILTLLQTLAVLSFPIPLVSNGTRTSFLPTQTRVLSSCGPRSDIANPHHEGYQPVKVVTITGSSAIVQIPLATSQPAPSTVGFVVTSLATNGGVNSIPLLTKLIPSPTSLLVPTYSTQEMPSEPTQPTGTPSADIFGSPISTNRPSSVFEERQDHPVPRLGINGPGPHGTNKFYANFFLGSQTSPAYVHPYALSWSKGQGATGSWGMAISHVEAKQRVYGEKSPETGAARYFLNPIGIQSLCLSAAELGSNTVLTSNNLDSHSAHVSLHPEANAKPVVTFPVVQGMGFVTALYKDATPVIETGVFFKIVTKTTVGPRPGMSKYTAHLEDDTVWHIYGYSPRGDTLDLTVLNNSRAIAEKPFWGTVQIAKDPDNAETVLDKTAGAYPEGMVLSGSTSGANGSYTFTFRKGGLPDVKLLMYALPHHFESFDDDTSKATSTVTIQTTTKGLAKAVVADSWTMIEPDMPISMGFAPWDPDEGPKEKLSDSTINAIAPVAMKELSQNMDEQSNLDSMYFSGKALAKFAGICYVANNMLKDPKLAQTGLASLKAAFQRFLDNKQKFPLFYDAAWGGLVSSATYTTGNSGVDFGNTFYNDHHFHYGYFIYAAAVIGFLDPSWLTPANIDYINTMVRDIANPSTSDKFFPVSRNFDWYHGHSWAHGLYETLDGKDQESSSEDAMAAYAIKMWGRTIKDVDMEARGNLMLTIIARSLSSYYLYATGNNVQPDNFVANKVAGILFENKIDHTTYFGSNIEYVQGIHMLPLLPSTKFTRPASFVQEEWETYFDKGRVDKVQGGWKGILYGNLATINPVAAWDFFSRDDFDPSWIDGGVSLTWYMAYTAAFM